MSDSRKSLTNRLRSESLSFIQIHDSGNLVLNQSPREQRRVTRIGRNFAAGADQQYIHRLTLTRELALVVEDNSLDSGALSNEPQQP